MAGLLASLQQLDAAAFLWLNGARHPLLDVLMPALSNKRYALVPAALLLLALLRWGGRRAWLLGAAALLALGVSDLTASAVKTLVERVRPCHAFAATQLLAGCTASLALPSNHATNMGALAAVAWVGSRRLGPAVAALALAVAYSRIYLGVHYPGDVLAGLLLGSLLGTAAALAALRALPYLNRRFPRSAPPAPAPAAGPGQDRQ
ncbi:MAG: phosphatase PAP2 family protein [Candidatus Methylomirabilales bacterium]